MRFLGFHSWFCIIHNFSVKCSSRQNDEGPVVVVARNGVTAVWSGLLVQSLEKQLSLLSKPGYWIDMIIVNSPSSGNFSRYLRPGPGSGCFCCWKLFCCCRCSGCCTIFCHWSFENWKSGFGYYWCCKFFAYCCCTIFGCCCCFCYCCWSNMFLSLSRISAP